MTLILFIILFLWTIIGTVTFCMYYFADTYNGIKFTYTWHNYNRSQKKFIFLAHGPLILSIAIVALSIKKIYKTISHFYTTVLDILEKQPD